MSVASIGPPGPTFPTARTYYPSCVVNLRIRFDEAYSVSDTPPAESLNQRATVPPSAAGGGKFPPLRPGFRPLLAEGFNPDNLSHASMLVPLSGEFELPAYRLAAHFSLSFAYKDLPIDPRILRACAVEVYLGTVRGEQFAEGMLRRPDPGRPRPSILAPTEDDLLMIGLVDSACVEHGERTSQIHLEGRDLRGLLIDAKADAAALAKIDLRRDIGDVVTQIVQLHPLGKRFVISTQSDDWPGDRIPSPATSDGLTRVRLGADGTKPRSTPQGSIEKLSLWDVIVKYCFLVGAIPYFHVQELRIRPVRSLYDLKKFSGFDPQLGLPQPQPQGAARRIPTPFKGGGPRRDDAGGQGEDIFVRRLVFGRNIANLKFERKFGGVVLPTIRVVSVDTSSKARGGAKLLEAFAPARGAHGEPHKIKQVEKARKAKVAPSGRSTAEEVLTIPVAGIRDKRRLQQVAEEIYEELRRGEMGGSVSTKYLSSLGGSNLDADLLRLRPGDAAQILIDQRVLDERSPLVSELTDQERRSFDEQVKAVFERVGDANLARAIVGTARGGITELETFFRVANVKYSWAASSVAVDFDYQTYVEARSGVTASSGDNLLPPTRKVASL